MSIITDSASEQALQAYSHPLSLQAKAISEFENRVLNGNVVSDVNNVFTFLTEFSSTMTANAVNEACNCFHSLYPENAQSSTDLYKHLSDFDYIGLFASPASATVELVFDRNFLIDKAVQVEGTIYKLILPEYSTFTIGNLTFGLMYPIEIRIRKAPALANGLVDYANCGITVMWDTSRENPLQTLESHILEHRDFVKDGQTLTAIEVPIYQFTVENHLEDAISSSGFARRYTYTDQFYAVRVFHFKNGQWNEMAQTLSSINYDVNVPTAMVKVLTELGKVEVVVPQIYFNSVKESSRIGNRILVKVYTTTGEVNLDVSEYSVSEFQASFLLHDTLLIEDDTYSKMLRNIPTLYVLPLSTRIASGKNGLTMESLRERVKHRTSYTVKITEDDLNAYFEAKGFNITKPLDNITDRVYVAHKPLTDKTGSVIASGTCGTQFTPEMTNIVSDDHTKELYVPNYSFISVLDQNLLTVQPGAIYKYDSEEDVFRMISDEARTVLLNKPIANKIDDLNTNLYTYSPFHTRISIEKGLPIAGSYDLYNPSLRGITFDWENTNTTAEMAVYSADVKVLESDRKTGYRLSVAIYKTENLSGVKSVLDDGQAVKNIQVMLSTSTSRGVYLYMLGTYNGKDSMGHDIFIFDIESDFKITKDSMIDAKTMYDTAGTNEDNFIDIGNCKYALSFFIKEEFITDTYPMQDVDITGVPGELDGYVYLCRQAFTMKFGESLPLLQNNVSISSSDLVYKTYPTTTFATYQSPVYERWTIRDFNDKVVNPVTNAPIEENKIGTIKLNVSYEPSKDETAIMTKVYYIKVHNQETGEDVYIPDQVTEDVNPSENHYEKRIRPVVKHQIGDVILNNRYDYAYGVAATIVHDDKIATVALDEPLTLSSDPKNVYSNIHDDLYITDTQNYRAIGVYTLSDRSKTGTKRQWRHVTVSDEEIFDVTELTVRTDKVVYRYVDDEGEQHFSLEAPPQYEYTAISPNGTYYSSNSPTVKNDSYVKSEDNTTVNTHARGLARSWYLLDGDRPYSFARANGFAIMHCPAKADEQGLVETWNLAYYYQSYNDDEKLELQFLVLDDDLTKSETLNLVDRGKLATDSYRAMHQEVFHLIAFSEDPNDYGWKLYETIDRTLETGLTAYYMARVVSGMPESKIPDPWDAEWEGIQVGDTTTPSITVLRTSEDPVHVRTQDAMSTIVQYIKDHHQTITPETSLYRYIDEGRLTTDEIFLEGKTYYRRFQTSARSKRYTYVPASVIVNDPVTPDTYYELVDPYIVDPLEGVLFTCVPISNNGHKQDPVNAVDYRPGYPDPRYSERLLEVGTETSFTYELTQDKTFFARKTYYQKISETEYIPVVVQEGDSVDPDTYYERIFQSGLGGVYYRDPEAATYTMETIGLSPEQIINILTLWQANVSKDEDTRYRILVEKTGIGRTTLVKLVSDSKPCFLFPWRRLINTSSLEALDDYLENRSIANCKLKDIETFQTLISDIQEVDTVYQAEEIMQYLSGPKLFWVNAIDTELMEESLLPNTANPKGMLLYKDPAEEDFQVVIAAFTKDYALSRINASGLASGYITLLEETDGTYYHLTSYTKDEGFNVNFEKCSWGTIDQWIWEMDDIWFTEDAKFADIKVSFNEPLSCVKAVHRHTDPVLDENGEPLIAEGGRFAVYTVDMLHCDYKLTISDDADYANYMSDIRELIRSYFLELKAITPSLLARTKLYFTPIRTFGNAKFKGSGGVDIKLPLEFSMDLGLHVESYVNGNDLNKNTIKENILTLITKHLQARNINLAYLAKDIVKDLSDNIIYVDVLGINGDKSLQTLLPSTNDCSPMLKQMLVLRDDGSVHADRALNLLWYTVG